MAIDPLQYRGPQWPIKRHLSMKYGSGALFQLYGLTNAIREDLYGV
jgi:hypothetical protein